MTVDEAKRAAILSSMKAKDGATSSVITQFAPDIYDGIALRKEYSKLAGIPEEELIKKEITGSYQPQEFQSTHHNTLNSLLKPDQAISGSNLEIGNDVETIKPISSLPLMRKPIYDALIKKLKMNKMKQEQQVPEDLRLNIQPM